MKKLDWFEQARKDMADSREEHRRFGRWLLIAGIAGVVVSLIGIGALFVLAFRNFW